MDGFDAAWQMYNEADGKYGYGGTHTLNPGAGKRQYEPESQTSQHCDAGYMNDMRFGDS